MIFNYFSQKKLAPFGLLGLSLCACGKGCEAPRPAPQAPVVAATPVAASALSLPDKVAQQLGITLPERKSSPLLPGLDRLPFRRLPTFDPANQLIVQVDAQGLRCLDQHLTAVQAQDEARVTQILRNCAELWRTRSGTQANRLVLALDSHLATTQAGQLRRLAQQAGQWRLVGLAREGNDLFELLLAPVPDHRPAAAVSPPSAVTP